MCFLLFNQLAKVCCRCEKIRVKLSTSANGLKITHGEYWNIFSFVSLVVIVTFHSGLKTIDFHGDESHWIGTSSVFEAYVREIPNHPYGMNPTGH